MFEKYLSLECSINKFNYEKLSALVHLMRMLSAVGKHFKLNHIYNFTHDSYTL
jgi:hypothetical protein